MLLRCESLEPPMLSWVKVRSVRAESALTSTPDISERDWHVSVVPILLQKYFEHFVAQH